jgi:hypothetical protein
MRRARPYRGENPEPGKDVTESLTPRPELENQDPYETLTRALKRMDWGLSCLPAGNRRVLINRANDIVATGRIVLSQRHRRRTSRSAWARNRCESPNLRRCSHRHALCG